MLLFFTSEKIHVFINDIELYQNNVIIKVAHHGSSSSSSEDLFKMIDPKVALISVGKNNRYRHPSYLTLKRLEAYGVKIYRSDLQGMVKIVYYGGKNYVMTSSGF